MATRMTHLIKGVALYTLYMFLFALVSSLMRFSAPLMPSQCYALMFVGEAISLTPLAVIIKRNWSLNTKMEWTAFIIWGIVLACSYVWMIYCTQNMPLGTAF